MLKALEMDLRSGVWTAIDFLYDYKSLVFLIREEGNGEGGTSERGTDQYAYERGIK